MTRNNSAARKQRRRAVAQDRDVFRADSLLREIFIDPEHGESWVAEPDTFKPRDRVYHYGQQWPGATAGTGTVVAVQRDERPGFTEILVWWDKPSWGGRRHSWINIYRLYSAVI